MAAIPVQVLDITQLNNGCMQVSITCCFCGKKHFHGAGVDELPAAGEGNLGTRITHCTSPNALNLPEYTLMLDAWYACGKKIKRSRK